MSSHKERTIGLNNKDVPPLLRTVGGKPRAARQRHERPKTPEDIDAPPIDSDAEDSEPATPPRSIAHLGGASIASREKKSPSSCVARPSTKRSARGPPLSLDSEPLTDSDIDSPVRGAIMATQFGKQPQSSGASAAPSTLPDRGRRLKDPSHPKTENNHGRQRTRRKRSRDEVEEAESPGAETAKAKPYSRNRTEIGGGHLRHPYGWTDTKKSAKRYGGKPPALKKEVAPEDDDEEWPWDGPDRRGSFRKPPSLPPPSPEKAARRRSLKVPSPPPEAKPEPRIPRLRMPPDSASIGERKTSAFKIPPPVPSSPTKSDAGEGSVDRAPGSPQSDFSAGSQVPGTETGGDTCPFCFEPVDKKHLLRFSKGKTLGIRRQIQFCQIHKRASARDIWRENGYPDIAWGELEGRFARHHLFLKRILAGGASHFRSLLEGTVARREEMTAMKTDRSLAPGYYGPRGLRVMSEYLIVYFAPILRKRAVEDKLVSARGSAVFVSTVLVPELAVRLIMEDMGVGEERARVILEESVAVGELLHDDEGDKVEDHVGEVVVGGDDC